MAPLFSSVGGVKVSIVAFQAIEPGSIPGWRRFFKTQLSATIVTCVGYIELSKQASEAYHVAFYFYSVTRHIILREPSRLQGTQSDSKFLNIKPTI